MQVVIGDAVSAAECLRRMAEPATVVAPLLLRDPSTLLEKDL
jgi:hypothetical protein